MSVTLTQTFGRQYTSDINGKVSAVRIYFAFATTEYTDMDDLITDSISAGLPDLGDSYSGSLPNVIVYTHIPKEVEMEMKVYQIEVRYQDSSFDASFPTARDWEISFSSVYEDFTPDVTRFDTTAFTAGNNLGVANNWRITNTAGFPFDPSVTDRRGMALIRLKKYFSTISEVGNSTITSIYDLMDRQNNVNDDIITIAGISGQKYQFWIDDIKSQKIKDGSGTYYSVDFSIIYDPQYHIQKVINAGWQEALPNDKAKAITGDLGGPISNPWPLDVNGKKIEGRVARRQNAIYLYFGTKPTSTFADLNLPTSY